MSVTLRPLAAPDSTAARALFSAALGDASVAEPMMAPLDAALARSGDEYRAIVAHVDGVLTGLVVFGEIAGARGAGRIYCVVVDGRAQRRGIGSSLIDAACADLRARGARFVVLELPSDSRLDAGRRVARQRGFREEGRIPDYVRDGIALELLRRDLD